MSVSIQDLKDHLRITDAREDSILYVYLLSAIDYLSSELGRKLSNSSESSYFDCFGDLELIGDNPSSVVVKYIDVDGVEQTLASSVYSLKTHKVRPYLTLAYGQSWPSIRSGDANVWVNYSSGYTDATLPDKLRAAVLIHAATAYEYRENETLAKAHSRQAVERLIRSMTVYKT